VERMNIDSPIIPGKTLFQEAIFLGGMILVTIEAMIMAGAYVVEAQVLDAFVVAAHAFPVTFAVSTLATTTIAGWRVFRHERIERRKLRRLDAELNALALENERLRRELAAMARTLAEMVPDDQGGGADVVGTAGVVQAPSWWRDLGIKFLQRYYNALQNGGEEMAIKAISRRQMVADNICTQHQWNIVNRLLVASGIRRNGREGMVPATYSEAVGLWHAWINSRRRFRRFGDDFLPVEAIDRKGG